jgi:hypothetical protein
MQQPPVRLSGTQALPDMPTLTYSAQKGQDTVTLTRDRRECERWAWRATRPAPRTGRDAQVSETVPSAGPDPRTLRHALSECMRARDYTVQW